MSQKYTRGQRVTCNGNPQAIIQDYYGDGMWNVRLLTDAGMWAMFCVGESSLDMENQAKHPLCYCSQLGGSTCDFCSGLRQGTIDDYRSSLEWHKKALRDLLEEVDTVYQTIDIGRDHRLTPQGYWAMVKSWVGISDRLASLRRSPTFRARAEALRDRLAERFK